MQAKKLIIRSGSLAPGLGREQKEFKVTQEVSRRTFPSFVLIFANVRLFCLCWLTTK